MASSPTIIDANGIQVITADENASISLGPTGIVIQEGLVTPPLITGQIGYGGFTTTNPNGIQFGSNLNINANTILGSDPITGSNISIDNDEILMVDGSDPQITQCSIRGSRIAFLQNAFPNRTLTVDPDAMLFTNGGFQTNIVGGGVTVQSGSGNSTLGGTGVTVNQTAAGGFNDPVITLINQNIAQGSLLGYPSMHFFKQGNLAAAGDVLGSQIYYGRDNGTGAKTEFARIQSSVFSATAGNNNGKVSIFTSANNVSQEAFNFIGAQSINNSLNPLSVQSSGSTGILTPTLTLTNTASSATGVALRTYKNKGTPGSNADVLFQHSAFGKNSADVEKEFTRTTHTIRDATASLEDSSIEMGCFVNGVFTNILQLNGNENEINALKPLDMTGNNIRTTTGNLAINVSSSATAGAVLTLATKNNVPGSGLGLSLTGDTLLSATAGGSSGQHLCLSINGTVYKIALLNA
jgi:hypothetical protein